MSLSRLALIGKTGVGKSRCGNTILGKREFKSSAQGSSVTTMCQLRDGIFNERHVSIVDSPGFNDTRTENQDQILREITRCIYLSSPGPHAICFVVQIGRFTTEDIDTIKAFVRHFGEEMYKYVIVVFTKFDDYKREWEEDEEEKKPEDRKKCDIKNYIKTLPPTVEEFIVKKCESRVIGFDNTLKGDASKEQVTQLFAMVGEMVANNGNTFYSNDDFKKAEAVIKAEMELEKLQVELRMKHEMEKRQKEIDAAANEKAKAKIKAEMKAFKAEIKEKMSSENLRKRAQESEGGFEKFSQIFIAVAPLFETLTKGIVDLIK